MGPFGSRMKAEMYVPSGVRVVRGNNLSGNREPEGEYVHVSASTADSLLSCCLAPGDLVFPHRGNIGEVGIIPDDGHRYMLSTSLMKLAVDQAKADPLFLMYFFKSAEGRAALLMNASQVGTPGIATPLKSLRGIKVRLPPLTAQRKVARILGEIDDRIVLLRETNKTLESIAQAIFKSWFVDFDPVRAKMEGRQPEGMDEETAALFPDSFEEAGLKTKPQGWKSGTLSAIMDLHKGSVNPGASPNAAFRHFSLPAYDAGQLPIVELGQAIKSNKTKVPGSSVLFSKLNPHIPRVWLPSVVEGHSVCSTEFLPFVPKNGSTTAFIYAWLSSPNFTAQIRGLVTGTSNSHQRIRPDNILSTEAILPPASVVEKFDGIVNALFERVKANRMTGKTLADLRDNLLPRLISGQLRLPEAQERVQNALP